MTEKIFYLSLFLLLNFPFCFSKEGSNEQVIKTATMYNFSDYPEWIRLFETPHIKVIANSNQYYLGRLLLITKTDELDNETLNQKKHGEQNFKLYPSMDYIINYRRDVYNELLDVLSALNKGRREWFRSEGLNESPTLFNELTADNLSFCENKKDLLKKIKNNDECIETFHHAHLHSIPRYKKTILLTYDKKASSLIRLSYYQGVPLFSGQDGFLKSKKSKGNIEKVWILFKDTEYGDIINFKKKLILVNSMGPKDLAQKGPLDKIKAEIQEWMMKSITKASLVFLKKAIKLSF